jgi:hypothetical protein
MQEDGQLTDRSLQATLSIAADAITSAVLAGKGVDSVYASELLVMTARGLQLPTAALGTTSSPTGRRLLQAQGGFVATATAGDRNDLLGTLDSLADLLDESAGPAIGWISAYGQGLSVSVVKEARLEYGYKVPVGPATSNTTMENPVQQADLDNVENAVVTFLADLEPSNTEPSVCVWFQMVNNAASLVTETPSPTAQDVDAFKAATWNNTLPPVAPPLINLTVLTPAVRIKLPDAPNHNFPCVAPGGNETVDCRISIKMPLLDGLSVDLSRLLLCLRISDDSNPGILVAPASEADGWQMHGDSASNLTCVTSKNGTYVIAAVDAVDTTPPAVIPPPTLDNSTNTTNTTACNGTVAFDGNGTTCGNAAVNGTLGDTNTTLANTTLTNTTGNATTEVSPSPSPEPKPSPSPSPDVEASPSPSPSPQDQTGGASPSPSPQPLQQGKPQTPAAKLSGVLINLGAVQQCQVSTQGTPAAGIFVCLSGCSPVGQHHGTVPAQRWSIVQHLGCTVTCCATVGIAAC